MQYLLLIYQPEAEGNTWSDQQKGALFQKYMAFNQEQKNHLRGGNPLKPCVYILLRSLNSTVLWLLR